jgi:hypothetical protein
MDDLSDPQVVKEACIRGLGWGLKHALPVVEIDRHGLVGTFDDNILPELLHVCWTGEIGRWMDDLLEEYMKAVHSSAALTVNTFGPLMLDAVPFNLGSHHDLKVERFERGSNDGNLEEPHLDLIATGPAGIVVIVSTCIDYVLGQIAGSTHQRASTADSAENVAEEKQPYRSLDAERLIGWAERLAAEAETPVTLVYLYWEPMDECLSPLFEEHREEIATFARGIAQGPVRFEALSYFELWNHWAESGETRLQEGTAALRARYEVPAWAWEGISWVNGRLNNSGLIDW